jgi:4-hydroxy-tetrahydrodipicolinate synthase
MAFDRLRGALADVVAIPVTPFTPDGRIDREAYTAVLNRMLEAGVRTVTTGGNTGEFYALTRQERRQLVELTVASCQGRAEVIAGVGLDLATAIEDAEAARDAGATMVMVHQPAHPYVSAEGWVDYHRVIAAAVPELGVLPYLRDPLIGGEWIGWLGEVCPNVLGVKYAVPDVARFAAVARDAGLGRFVWIAGLAELYAPAYWALGATGFTSGLVNVAPQVSLTMLRALRAGDFPAAMTVWEQVREFEELRATRHSEDNVAVVKEALAALGLCGRDIRPPSRTLPAELRERIATLVAPWRAV